MTKAAPDKLAGTSRKKSFHLPGEGLPMSRREHRLLFCRVSPGQLAGRSTSIGVRTRNASRNPRTPHPTPFHSCPESAATDAIITGALDLVNHRPDAIMTIGGRV